MNTWLIATVWMTIALAAALGSMRLGISVALVEILLGVFAGNTFHLQTTPWIDFLAGAGSIILAWRAWLAAKQSCPPTSLAWC
jgi:Kef-type K+ transport system membrane component KefB